MLPVFPLTDHPVNLNMSDEVISLIRVSLDSLVSAAEVFPSVIKTDLYACIFHIFTSKSHPVLLVLGCMHLNNSWFTAILGTGMCQAAIIPQALPIFKQYVQAMAGTPHGFQNDEVVAAELHACLARFLNILANAQKRETETSLSCVKNTLLASTILVTAGAGAFPGRDKLMDRLVDELVDCLSDRMVYFFSFQFFFQFI